MRTKLCISIVAIFVTFMSTQAQDRLSSATLDLVKNARQLNTPQILDITRSIYFVADSAELIEIKPEDASRAEFEQMAALYNTETSGLDFNLPYFEEASCYILGKISCESYDLLFVLFVGSGSCIFGFPISKDIPQKAYLLAAKEYESKLSTEISRIEQNVIYGTQAYSIETSVSDHTEMSKKYWDLKIER